MAVKYVDIPSIVQVIGGVYLNNSFLDNEKYFFCEEDFTEDFHRILFEAIFNLHALGVKKIDLNSIEDYLEQRPKKKAIFIANKGEEYLTNLESKTQLAAFDYYYNRIKKLTLFRMYHQRAGMDLSDLYDMNNIMDIKKKQAQEDWLDNTSLNDIADIIDKRVLDIRLKFVDDVEESASQAGEGLLELIERFKTTPELGYPLYGPLINTITRGARLKKFYLRSAATGVGKTRSMIADACSIACNEIYDVYNRRWIENGTKEPVVFISTEQEIEEVQTMMVAFLSGVDEEHLLTGTYTLGEWDRVVHAIQVIKNCPLYIQQLPDFSLQDIENTIRQSIRDHDVKYCFFDYVHTSMKILGEVSSKTGVRGLREDNILFMVSIRLKDLCNQYGIFILTATQLNSDYVTAQQYDQNLLRGAKSIADKIDCGMIMLEVSQEDLVGLETILKKEGFEVPTVKISIYKNRRGKYKNVLLWCKADRGTCRIEPMFMTDYTRRLIPIEDLKINVKYKDKTEESAF